MTRNIKIICVGHEDSEIHEILTLFVTGEKDDNYVPSLGVTIYKKQIPNLSFTINFFILGSASKDFKFMMGSYIKGSLGGIIGFSLKSSSSWQMVYEYIQIIKSFTGDIPLLIIANHRDKSETIVKPDIRDSYQKSLEELGYIYIEYDPYDLEKLNDALIKFSELLGEKKELQEKNDIDRREKENLHNLETHLKEKIPPLTDFNKHFGYVIRNNYIEELYLRNKELTEVPQEISNFKNLKILDLRSNQLSYLPNFICDMIQLTFLNISNNNFRSLPFEIWSLKNLQNFRFDGNPLDGESNSLIGGAIDLIKDFCRQRATIKIFMSHAVVEWETFHIKEISEFLDDQDEIYKIFYCEEDLTGNIDDFMNRRIPQCQIVLFFASKKSVFNSEDCKHELELARKHNVQIIPIKGPDLKWKELRERALSRELGHEFVQEDF